ncbi:hypothetical protein [Pectinatus frisingensis]|uniref:hypothetical protein n=1 Tax=Pectinatus frisingensis TaxID=865 RepID=UPI0018C605D1|nr:hypothetical protein [Pectinatus frisingensis]
MDETPFVPKQVVSWLKQSYSTTNLIGGLKDFKTTDEAVGYMKGVYEVINTLDALSREDDKD